MNNIHLTILGSPCFSNILNELDFENSFNTNNKLNYNMKPTIKGKGSAIFIHVANKNFKKTAGCIALKKIDLRKLIKVIDKDVKIIIN